VTAGRPPRRRVPSGRRRAGSPPARRDRPQPDAARLAAFDLLRAVDERDAYANLVLPGLLRERGLTGRDAGFATELGYGTLRGRGTYGAVLAACVDRPLGSVDPPVLDLLRLGAHQLLAMRVPPHAAVGATVELARSVVGEGAGSFVNAVLRKVARRDLAGWVAEVAPPLSSDPVGHLAVAHSHPPWVVTALRDALGGELDETTAALRADNVPAEVALVARPGRSTVAELVASGARASDLSPYAAILPGGDPADLAAVREGRAGVQDEGSQLVALALAGVDVASEEPERWLDMCAGPGGKTALLAAVRPDGVHLTAADRAPHRAELVAKAVRGEADVDVLTADGTRPAWEPASFDRVLLDAPCTGLGALRRRPEVRWRRTPEDVPPLVELQTALLDSALSAVRVGGVVAYVTCSPHSAETVAVVDAVAARDDVEVIPVAPLFPEVPDAARGEYGQLWPHRHGTDAMFMALLRRTR
jgi:16S rRNA (cytosine967-C5)-methyltransferase